MAAALAATRDEAVMQSFGDGPLRILALPPHPGLDLGYAWLARALPEATVHAVRFMDKPIPALLECYMHAFDRIAACMRTVLN